MMDGIKELSVNIADKMLKLKKMGCELKKL